MSMWCKLGLIAGHMCVLLYVLLQEYSGKGKPKGDTLAVFTSVSIIVMLHVFLSLLILNEGGVL